MRLKRLLRRFIPDRVMARYRLSQHSRHVRTNLVLYVPDRRAAVAWTRTTPDTVRVLTRAPTPEHGPDTIALGAPAAGIERFVSGSTVAVVESPLGRPRLRGGRRSLPPVRPRSVVVDGEVAESLGLTPGLSPPEAYRRLVDAGYEVCVVPVEGEGRSDLTRIEAPSVVIVSAVPMHDVGGGSRTAQFALELLRQGFHVTYLSVFPAAESVDLGLRFVHPLLEQRTLAEFDAADHSRRAAHPTICLVALPIRPAVETAERLAEDGFHLVYDLIDDWSDPALGAEWYSREVEDRLIGTAAHLVGSAGDLVRALERRGREAVLIPNAVNAQVFSAQPGPRPADMPDGPVLGYHGSLYGNWFDWQALARVAVANDDATVVVIGDIPAGVPALPPNVRLLGLKAHTALPDYVGHFDVGLLPFALTETTHAVSPLKVFEYLAMGAPVAAPPLRALEGLEGVYVSEDLVEAVEIARRAPRPDRSEALRRHSWATRVETLLLRAEVEAPGNGHNARVEIRPAVHHPASERLI